MSLVTHLRDNTVLLFRLHQQFTFIGSSDKRLFHIHMDAKLHRLHTNREIAMIGSRQEFSTRYFIPPNSLRTTDQFASRLLVTTSLTIEEIMYQSGFMNRSHFYKKFTKRIGVAPKDYRLHNKKIGKLQRSHILAAISFLIC